MCLSLDDQDLAQGTLLACPLVMLLSLDDQGGELEKSPGPFLVMCLSWDDRDREQGTLLVDSLAMLLSLAGQDREPEKL